MEIDAQTINKMTKEEQYKYLKDGEFRKKLFESENHYPFVWLVQDLKGESISYLLDENIISLLKDDPRCADKLNAIITCDNEYKNVFLSNDKVIKLVYDNKGYLDVYFRELNLSFGEAYFNHIYDKNLDFEAIEWLNSDVQLSILRNNLDKIKNSNVKKDFLLCLSKDSIEFLLTDLFFINPFLNCSVHEINCVIKKGVTLPTLFHSSKELIDKYVNIKDVTIFNEYCSELEKNNSYLKDIIRNKKNEMYKTVVNSIDFDLEIFSEYKPYLDVDSKKVEYDHRLLSLQIYQDKENRLKYLQEMTITRLLEMIVDMNYEDITFNFLKNLESMLNFVSQVDIEIIPKDRLKIYNKLYNFYELSIKEQIDLFFELANMKDNMAHFYDDFRNCLNCSYKLINDSCFNCSEYQKSNLSNTLGVDVYELDGKPFKMLINHTLMQREIDYLSGLWKVTDKKTSSLSLIGNEYLGTFRDPSENVILGFTNVDTKNIMHIHPSDSFSNHEYGSKYVIRPFTPENFLKNTSGYNEILIKENNDLYPSYVVCYDEIKEGDLRVAKFLDIPLVLIHTSKYNTSISSIFKSNDKYISHGENYMISDYRKGR